MRLLGKGERLVSIIENSFYLQKVVTALYEFKTEDIYIGAGAIAQTVWNALTNRPLDYGIDDIDIVYYNSQRIEEKYEQEIREYLDKSLGEHSFWIDVKNQARVHLWYKDKFGYEIKEYNSMGEAINTWPTTATSLGIRKISENSWEIYAPFGFDDLFNMIVVANNRQITKDIYDKKVYKWIQKWPELTITEWSNHTIPFDNDKRIYIKK